jgi:hypothetical protein
VSPGVCVCARVCAVCLSASCFHLGAWLCLCVLVFGAGVLVVSLMEDSHVCASVCPAVWVCACVCAVCVVEVSVWAWLGMCALVCL